MDRIAEKRPIGVEQAIVDTPGIDPDRVDVSRATSHADAVENATVEAEHIPVDMSACPDGSIPEPVDLMEFEMILREPGDEDTPARRAEIDRHALLFRRASRRHPNTWRWLSHRPNSSQTTPLYNRGILRRPDSSASAARRSSSRRVGPQLSLTQLSDHGEQLLVASQVADHKGTACQS